METIRAGSMTKDLAICVHNTTKVTPDRFLNTIPFMDEIVPSLNTKLAVHATNLNWKQFEMCDGDTISGFCEVWSFKLAPIGQGID